MSPYLFELAEPADDEGLRAVMARTPMPGAISVVFRREPSYFGAAVVEGRFRQAMVVRDATTRQIVGIGARSISRRFVNGQSADVGYLSGLRILEEHRCRGVLARGFAFLRRLHADGRTPVYLTTIAEHNRPALNALVGGRAGLPTYHYSGQYHTAAIRLRGVKPVRLCTTELEIRSGRTADLPAVLEFLHRIGPARQFFPCYVDDDFGSDTGALRGLELADLCLALRDRQLVGVLGGWDQRAFRQMRITGYRGAMRWMRPCYNAWARMRSLPRLPSPGEPVRYLTAAVTAVADDDPGVFRQLLDFLIGARSGRSWEYLLVGMHESDPLMATLREYRAAWYATNVYLVCWQDGDALRQAIDSRPVYLELGSL
jgi:hypothetical protein